MGVTRLTWWVRRAFFMGGKTGGDELKISVHRITIAT